MTAEELLNKIDEDGEPVTITMTYRKYGNKDLLATIQIGNARGIENIAASNRVLAQATRELIQRIINANL